MFGSLLICSPPLFFRFASWVFFVLDFVSGGGGDWHLSEGGEKDGGKGKQGKGKKEGRKQHEENLKTKNACPPRAP